MEKICPNCHHLNEFGSFCEKCGTRLHEDIGSTAGETAAGTEGETAGPSFSNHASNVQSIETGQGAAQAYLQNAKKASKLYFGYIADVLKKPYETARTTGSEQFVNGLITMGLFALLIPLMMYLGFLGSVRYVDAAFWNILLKPLIGYAIFIILVASITFGALQVMKIKADYKEVIAKFGVLLVPFVGLLAIEFVLSLFQLGMFTIYLMSLLLMGTIFAVPALLITSYKRDSQAGTDTMYGALLTYLLIFIVIWILNNMLFGAIGEIISGSIFSSFF